MNHILKRHRNVICTIERWLIEAGFARVRINPPIITEPDHADIVSYWRLGSKLLVTLERSPLEDATQLKPAFELYGLLDNSNQMDRTREAIMAYAGRPITPVVWTQMDEVRYHELSGNYVMLGEKDTKELEELEGRRNQFVTYHITP